MAAPLIVPKDKVGLRLSRAFWEEIVMTEVDTMADESSERWHQFADDWSRATGGTRKTVWLSRSGALHAVHPNGALYQNRDIWQDNFKSSWVKLAARLAGEIEDRWPGIHNEAGDTRLSDQGPAPAAVEIGTLEPGARFMAAHNPSQKGTLLSLSPGCCAMVRVTRPKKREFETHDGKKVSFGTKTEDITWSLASLVVELPSKEASS